MANGTQKKGRNNRANPSLAGRIDEKGRQIPKELQNLSEKEMSDQIKTILSVASDTLHFSAGDKEKVREAIRTFNDSTITISGTDINVEINSAKALYNLMHGTVSADPKVGEYKVEDYQDGAKLTEVIKKFAAAYQTAQIANEMEYASLNAQISALYEQIRQIKAEHLNDISTLNAAHVAELDRERARHSAQLRDKDAAYDAALAAEANKGAAAVYNEKKKKNILMGVAIALAATTVAGAIGTGVGFSVAGAQRRRADSAEAKYQTLESEYDKLDALFNDVISVLENNNYNVDNKANVDDIVESIINGKGGADANSIYQDILNQFDALGIDLDALKDENGNFNKDAVNGKLGEIVSQYIENADVVTYWTNTMNDVLGKIQKKDSNGVPMVDESGNKIGYSLNDFASFEGAWDFVNNTFSQKVELILNQIPKESESEYVFTVDNKAVETEHYSLSDFETVGDAIDFIGDMAVKYAEGGENDQYKALKDAYDSLSSDYNTLQSNYDKSQRELQNVKDINKLLEGQIDALEAENAELEGTISGLQDQIKEKDATIAQKDGEISELNSTISGLRSDLATATAEKAQAEENVNTLQGELDQAESDRDEYKAAAEEWQKKAEENQENAEKAQALADSYKDLYESVDDTIIDLTAQLTQAQEDLKSANERVSSLESQLATAQSERDQAQRDLAAAQAQVDELTQRVDRLQEQLNLYQNGAQANPSTPSTGNNNAQVGSGDTDPENNNKNPGHNVGGPEENEEDNVSGK